MTCKTTGRGSDSISRGVSCRTLRKAKPEEDRVGRGRGEGVLSGRVVLLQDTLQSVPRRNMAGRGRAEQGRAEQGRAGQGRTGHMPRGFMTSRNHVVRERFLKTRRVQHVDDRFCPITMTDKGSYKDLIYKRLLHETTNIFYSVRMSLAVRTS